MAATKVRSGRWRVATLLAALAWASSAGATVGPLGPGAQASVQVPLGSHGDLTATGLRYVQDRTDSILVEKGVTGDYRLLLFPEMQEATVRAESQALAEVVAGTLRSVLDHYLTAVRTRTFRLQYADPAEVAGLLSKIYAAGGEAKGQVHIQQDVRSNSVVATAPLSVLNKIQATIETLDQRTTQVLIRVLIAEVTLDRDTKYGIEWSFANSGFFGGSATATSDVDFGTLAPANQAGERGLKYTILKAGRLRSFLQLLESRSHIHVLSAPQLVTSNNTDAYFEETVKVPILKTVTTATGVVNTSVDYADIGIKLDVTPHINADEYIRLKIEQTIQNILANPTVQNAPTFSNRVVRTGVLAKDNHTVVLGGLIKNNERTLLQKVPVLGDLPGIKHLFRRRTKDTEKTELMVFITPQIVRTDRDLDEVVERLRAPRLKARLKALKEEFRPAPPDDPAAAMVVVDAQGDAVTLGLAHAEDLRTGEVLEVVRAGKQYIHPVTNQVVETEDERVAKLQVQEVRARTATAEVIWRGQAGAVRRGDPVRRPVQGFAFSNMIVHEIDARFDFRGEGLAVQADCVMENESNAPLLKMTTRADLEAEGNRYYRKVDGEWRPLRVLRSGQAAEGTEELTIYLGGWLRPGERAEIRIELDERLSSRYREFREAALEDGARWMPLNSNIGVRNPECQMRVEMHHLGKLEVRGMDELPAQVVHPDGTASLFWTHRGAPFRIRGEVRFVDAAAARRRRAALQGGAR